MPRILRHPWPVLLAGLLLGLAWPAPARQGTDKGATAKQATPPSVYALLHVARHPPKVLGDGPQAALDPGEPAEYRRTQLALLRSRLVLTAALREPVIAKMPLVQQLPDSTEWLAKHLRAEFLNGTGVLRVSVGAGTPREQAALANAVANAYLREIVNKENGARLARLERLKKLHADYDGMLRSKRETLRRLISSLGSRDAKLQKLKQQLALTQLNALQTELIQVRSQLRRSQLERKLLEEENTAPPEAAVQELIEKDAQVARLHSEVRDLKETLDSVKKRSSNPEQEPVYKRTLDQLKASLKALAARRERLRPAAVSQARAQTSGASRLKRQTALLQELERVLTEDVDRRSKELTAVQNGVIDPDMDLKRLRDEIARAAEVARAMGMQIQRLSLEIEAPPRVRLLEEASAPR
jgi:hypothetical protein